jgi:hypothetical protein
MFNMSTFHRAIELSITTDICQEINKLQAFKSGIEQNQFYAVMIASVRATQVGTLLGCVIKTSRKNERFLFS